MLIPTNISITTSYYIICTSKCLDLDFAVIIIIYFQQMLERRTGSNYRLRSDSNISNLRHNEEFYLLKNCMCKNRLLVNPFLLSSVLTSVWTSIGIKSVDSVTSGWLRHVFFKQANEVTWECCPVPFILLTTYEPYYDSLNLC